MTATFVQSFPEFRCKNALCVAGCIFVISRQICNVKTMANLLYVCQGTYLGNIPRYQEMWELVKLLLTLSHGQAQVKRGFSTNKDILSSNMAEESVITNTIYITSISQILLQTFINNKRTYLSYFYKNNLMCFSGTAQPPQEDILHYSSLYIMHFTTFNILGFFFISFRMMTCNQRLFNKESTNGMR